MILSGSTIFSVGPAYIGPMLRASLRASCTFLARISFQMMPEAGRKAMRYVFILSIFYHTFYIGIPYPPEILFRCHHPERMMRKVALCFRRNYAGTEI